MPMPCLIATTGHEALEVAEGEDSARAWGVREERDRLGVGGEGDHAPERVGQRIAPPGGEGWTGDATG